MNWSCTFLLALACLLGACAPVTPEERIAKNPTLFQSLPAKHQSLVQQGEIARGMSHDAVILAWGKPSRRYSGMHSGGTTDRWDYFGSQPVYNNHFGIAHGYGYGHRGRGSYNALAYSPEITYVPYRRATVLFKNQKVDSWDRMQSPVP
jgi:hypothetical protein